MAYLKARDVSGTPIDRPLACTTCSIAGHLYAQPQLRACDPCIKTIPPKICLKKCDVIHAQDGEASNNTMLRAINERIEAGGLPNLSMTYCMPDLTHAAKRDLGAVSNYYVMLGGELFSIRVVMICLYYGPDYNPHDRTRCTVA